MSVPLIEELRDVLRELVETTDAISAAIVSGGPGRPIGTVDVDDVELRRVPLGSGTLLEARFPGASDDADARAPAVERAARSLRACARRWGCERLPEADYRAASEGLDRNRVTERIRVYLQAWCNAQGMVNALVTVRDQVVATAYPLEELQRERIPFLLKQVEAEVVSRRGETAHVELLRDDLCVFGFWIDACLIAFCDGNHSVDFVRHRARLVTREVSQLLPHLDDPPSAPARLAPIPE
jgi:hypothetical protein